MSTKAQEVAFDRTLVDRFKGGDQSAFDEMVSRYWDRIYSMVNQLLRNPQDAEEVTQDAFIRAHRGLVNFRGDSAFSTWLYQIATNLARNRYWYWWRRKRDQSVSFDAPIAGDNDTTLADLIPAEVETPDDITVTQEFVTRIGTCMEKLGAKHREILILRNVKNLSYEEIATILNISVGTVKSRIARAREGLRAKLGGGLQMKDKEFIELLNLYVDQEITSDDAARLEGEVMRDQNRRKIYLQYCRMQKACTILAAPLADAAVVRPERNLVAPVHQHRWTGQLFPAALAAAACLAVVFVVRAYRTGLVSMPSAPVVAQVTPAVQVAAPRSAPTDAPSSFTPVFSARSDAIFASDEAASKQFDWLDQIHMAPVQATANAEQLFAIRPELKPVNRSLQGEQPVDMVAFQIHQ